LNSPESGGNGILLGPGVRAVHRPDVIQTGVSREVVQMTPTESTNNEPATHARHPVDPRDDSYDDDTISLWPLVLRLWHYRMVIILASVVTVGVIGLALGWATLRAPTQQTARVGFRLMFQGAEKGQYPNGTPFGPSDITSTPILTDVYKANKLEPYGTFDAFKAAIFAQQSNRRLKSLEDEYRLKLADTKLDSYGRQRYEREFDVKSKGFASADFEMTFVQMSLFNEMPATLANKVLSDILISFAKDAGETKGVLKYGLSIPTRNMVPSNLIEEEDYIVAFDMLRDVVRKSRVAATALEAIPGANAVRVGPSRLALTDIQSRLDNLLRFGIDPMIGFVRAVGVTKNATLTIQYLRNRLFTIRLGRDTAKRQVVVYEESLRNYVSQRPGASSDGAGITGRANALGGAGNTSTVIPQLGDSFFDRLIELGTKGDDTAFRQAMVKDATAAGMKLVDFEAEQTYYEDLLKAFEGAPKATDAASSKQFFDVFQVRYPRTLKELLTAIDDVNLLYDTLSQHNLNPVTSLITITNPPAVTTQSTLPAARMRLAALLGFLGAEVVIVLGALVFGWFRDERRARAWSEEPGSSLGASKRNHGGWFGMAGPSRDSHHGLPGS
jgi:hypothetical protein